MLLFFSVTGCILALLIAILNVRELIIVYFYLLSGLMLYFSYILNVRFLTNMVILDVEKKTSWYELGAALIPTITFQCVLGFLYQYLNPRVLKYKWLSKTVLVSFLSPAFLFLIVPYWTLEYLPFYSLILPFAISKYIFWSNIPTMMQYIIHGWRFCRNFVMRV